MRSGLGSSMACVSLLFVLTGCGFFGATEDDAPTSSPSPGAGPGSGSGSGGGSPVPLSLSGRIVVPSGTASDSDVNDPMAAFAANDAVATAQIVPNPVMLGGYANQPGSGPSGRSQAAGDARDLYRVQLTAGDQVRLYIEGAGAGDDLDLALLDLTGALVATAAEAPGEEVLTVATSGDHIVEVTAFAGAANYVLSIGPGAGTLGAVQPEFVPGEVIVRFRDAGSPSSGLASASASSNAARGRRLAADLGMDLLDDRGDGLALLACRDEQQRDVAFRAMGVGHLIEDDPSLRMLARESRLARDTMRLAKALRMRDDVASADRNYLRQPLAVPADEFSGFQWHYPQINLPAAWDRVTRDSGVVVAVIDTGVLTQHPDLSGQLVDGYDFISSPGISVDGDGCDPDANDPGDGLLPGTSSYHGTHVAGTVAARTSFQLAGDTGGVAGVAWNARVMPLRVLGRGGGTDFDIMQAVKYAAGRSNACNALPSAPAHVINMSLGGPGFSSAFEAVIAEARAEGLVVVAAAGNDGTDQPLYPAAYDGVISVSAVDRNDTLAFYSTWGATIDVAAPGGDLRVDQDNDGYADGVLSLGLDETFSPAQFAYYFSMGTSMAAPHVAGVVALMLGVNPTLTPADVDTLLAMGLMTRDLGNPAFFGNGVIDADAAVLAAQNAVGGGVVPSDARLAADPVSVTLGPLESETVLVLSNAGNVASPLSVSSANPVTDDGAPWLTLTAVAVDANGLGQYRLSVDRSLLGVDGQYTGRVVLDSSVNDFDVLVSVDVAAAAGAPADAGRHYILLLDSATGVTRYGLALENTSGEYVFSLTGIDPGDYQVVAGSDRDNDGDICDEGEACGGFPNLEGMLSVTVDGAITNVDFTSQLRFGGPVPLSQGSFSTAVHSAL